MLKLPSQNICSVCEVAACEYINFCQLNVDCRLLSKILFLELLFPNLKLIPVQYLLCVSIPVAHSWLLLQFMEITLMSFELCLHAHKVAQALKITTGVLLMRIFTSFIVELHPPLV